jgi:hypothetical protein
MGDLPAVPAAALLPGGAMQLPEACPVDLWAAVLSQDGTLLAAAPLAGSRFAWRHGHLATRLPVVDLPVMHAGVIAAVWVIAVSGQEWAPVTPLELGSSPKAVRAGDHVHLHDSWLLHQFGPG